jgi:hypothetical protein
MPDDFSWIGPAVLTAALAALGYVRRQLCDLIASDAHRSSGRRLAWRLLPSIMFRPVSRLR